MKGILPLCICLLLSVTLYAQRTVTGKVTDSSGSPLGNVSVQVRNSNVGTKTNDAGVFSIQLPEHRSTLVFSYIGYESREVDAAHHGTLNVSLATSRNNMQEVVVTALGITRDKRSLGYATQTVKGEELVDRGEVNLVNALQGKLAGVDITGASGSAGASANINIRGITSFNGNNQPLFVVDGIPISNDVDRTGNTLQDQQPANRALDLNLNDIESVNVLKGPAAAVLYGSRASSGAIVITTKRGTAGRGKVKITATSSYTQQEMYGFPQFQNEYGQGTSGQFNATSTSSWGPKFGSTPTLANGLLTTTGQAVDYRAYPTNIIDFFETGNILENSVNVNSGDARQNLNFSVSNTDQKGILPNSGFDRTNLAFKFNSYLTDKFKVGASVDYIISKQLGITHGNGATSALFQLFSVPRSFDLAFYKEHYKNPDGSNNWPLNTTRDNPYFAAYEDPVTSKVNRTIGNVSLGYDINNWLNVSYRLGIDAYTDRRKKITAVGSNAAPGGQGRVLEDNFFRSELNGDLIITAKRDNLFSGINANFTLGQNINNRIFQNSWIQADSLSIPGYYNVANGSRFDQSGESNTVRRLLGYYGQIALSYENYLFLELTGRVDQSSTLPIKNNTYFYPGVAASFVFTDALRLQSNILTYGKLRASFAKVGKDADPYLLDNVYVLGGFGNNVAQFTFPFGVIPGWSASSRIANDELTPEFTSSYEAGINLGFFRNRITLDATYFYTSSTNQILNVAIPASTGYLTKTSNVGEMTNKGIELLLTATPVSTRNFSWDISANFTRIRNKVVEIGGGVTVFSINGNRFTGALPSVVEGQPYGVVVGNKWQRSPDGQLIINPATGIPNGTDAGVVIANPNRDFIAGLTNSIKYKNFSFSVLVDYKQGGDIVSWGAIALRNNGSLKETGVDRDQPRIFPGVIKLADGKFVPNTIQIPAQTYWQAMGQTSGAGDLGVFDATVMRLREVTVSYDIPVKKFISRARVTFFGRNLFFYAPNSPFDTEINHQGAGNLRGLELQSNPNVRNIGVSLKLTF